MKEIVILALSALLAACGSAALKSPSGNIEAELFADANGIYYRVTSDSRTVIDTSAMGLRVDGTDYFRDTELTLESCRSIDTAYLTAGRKALAHDRCNEYLYQVTHRPSGYVYRLYARLYDDGFAYRFVMPGSGERTVNGEAAQWRPPLQARVWLAERNSAWKLLTYAGEWISTSADSLHIRSQQGPIQIMPLLYQTAQEYILITEAALYDYSGMRLRAEAGGSLRANFTEPEGFSVTGDIVTPWRVTVLAKDLNALVNTDIITNLNPDPDPELFADTSWIVPGRSLWSWWSGIGGRFMTPEGEKGVIDIAARLGVEYSTIDDGWEEVPDKWAFLCDLVGYARERNVGLFVWRHWQKINDPADDYRQMRDFLDSVARVGVRGVKIDFMNGEGKRQVDFNTKLLQNAARRKLLVNLHGCQKSTGEIRTYPNEITREGVRGIELNRITANYETDLSAAGKPADPDRYVPGNENQNIPASHNAALPFTRGVVGAADYTPIAFSLPGKTTPAHQLAFALLLDSPLLTIAEDPFLLVDGPRYAPAVEVIRRMPTTWDETVVLPGSEIGRTAFMARRKGEVWYVGGVNTSPLEYKLKIDFPDKAKWHATLVCDSCLRLLSGRSGAKRTHCILWFCDKYATC